MNFNNTAYFVWDESQAKSSSTHRKLLAVKYSLLSLAQCLEGKVVTWYCDNQNAFSIAINGSMNDSLQRIALGINYIQLTCNVRILPRWILRSENKLVDKRSKIIDPDSWSVNRSIFNHFDSIWGPHTFDRFANN